MSDVHLNSIIALLKDGEEGPWNIQEIYHAILEYIKSGEAISDMGHPDFKRGARGDKNFAINSSFSPGSGIFKLASACSRYLNNYDMNYIWYRDLSTWEKYCKYIVELKQIRYFQRHFGKVIKSYKYYVRKIVCPACGTVRYSEIYDITNEVHLEQIENKVFVDCIRCGKYVMQIASFKYLDTFEKKAKLYVFLSTRANRTNEFDLEITTKILKKIFE